MTSRARRYRRVLSWGAAVAAFVALAGSAVFANVVLTGDAASSVPRNVNAASVKTPMQSGAPAPGPFVDATATPKPAPDLPASSLVIPAADISIDVVGVSGVEGGRIDGTVQLPVPPSAHQVGRWSGSELTGGAPSAEVLIGHVVWGGEWSQLSELSSLAQGASIWTTDADGRSQEFQLDRIAQSPKLELPQEIFYDDGSAPSKLVIITCGGDVDDTGHHVDNIIAYASPVG